MTFAQHLIALRTARQWTPSDLARRAGLTPEAIYQLEKGTRKPSIETLCKLRSAFGVSMDYLTAPFCDSQAA